MYRVLLISLVNWDSLIEIPAMLKDGGCTVDVFAAAGSWTLQNRSFNKWIPASDTPDKFLTELLAYIGLHGSDYNWLIPADDIIIRVLNANISTEDIFSKVMPLTKIENRALLGSKAGLSDLCIKYDIKTPRYLVYDESLTPAAIGDYIGFPLLMKLDQSEGGYGVYLIRNEADLAERMEHTANKDQLVFQQFIKGFDANTDALFKNGELIIYSYSRTLTVMREFGVSTQRLFYRNEDVEAELIKMGRALGLSGFANITFMYDEKDGEHYLIEIDMRPNAWMYYGKFRGNDFSEGIRRAINNELELVKPAAIHDGKRIKISLYKKDVYRCLVEKDMKGLMGWMSNKEAKWRYIPFYDRKLLFSCNRFLFRTLRELTTQKIRKTFKM